MTKSKAASEAAAAGKPRGRMSPFAFFMQACREEHKLRYPNEFADFVQLTKKCSARWKVSKL